MVSGFPAHLRALAAAVRLSMLTFLADPQWVIPSSIAPVIFALAAFELYKSSGPVLVLTSIVGAAMMSMWGQTLYGSGWATGQDRELGTLEPTLTSSTPYLWVVAGRVIVNAVTGLAGGGLVYVVVASVYHRPLPVQQPWEFAVLFVFVLLTLASVGIVLAAFFVYTRYAGFIQNFGEFAFYIGTGCMFPVILLPLWATPVGLLLPPTWAIDALRYSTLPGYAGFSWGLAGDVAGALGTTLVYLLIAGAVFRRVERHVLEVGNLGEY
jgi:ABC-type polysaccharide/polyol phosphate export permease